MRARVYLLGSLFNVARVIPSTALVIPLFTGGLACSLTASMASAACPTSHVAAGNLSHDSTLPSDGQSFNGCNVVGGCGSAFASYSIPNGSLSVSFNAQGDFSTGADARVQDDFTVVGVPAGTPVALVAHLHATLSGTFPFGNHVASVSATLTDANGNQATAFAPPSTDQDLTIPVAAVAGQQFRLTFEINGGTQDWSGGGNGAFLFSGLPAGTAVTSCNGYVSDASVPVRQTSWGRIQQLYR
jgi:hypothetical protein